MAVPELVLVAGPNGSGKTTITQAYLAERFPSWPRLNADQLLAELLAQWQPSESTDHPPGPLDAARRIDETAFTLAALGAPFILETVLSSDKYRRLIHVARSHDMVFRLVYVTTETSRVNVGRVAMRVEEGGHDVPEDRIHSRWERSMNNLAWFAARADRLVVWDNSGTSLRVVGLRHLGCALELNDELQDHPAFDRLAALRGKLPVQDEPA
jgi:predicted ABC-type ATPase